LNIKRPNLAYTREDDESEEEYEDENEDEDELLKEEDGYVKDDESEDESEGEYEDEYEDEDELLKEEDGYAKDDESEEEYEDEYEDENELLKKEDGYTRREDENENEYGDKNLKKWANSKQYEPQEQHQQLLREEEGYARREDENEKEYGDEELKKRVNSKQYGPQQQHQHQKNLTSQQQQRSGQQLYTKFEEQLDTFQLLQQQQCSQQQKQQQPESKHQEWSDSHQGNVVGDDVISKILNLERKTADKIGCVDLEENTGSTLVNLWKQYIQQLQQEQHQQQLAGQQLYTELEEKLEAHQQWHQHQLGQQQKQSSQQQQQQQQEDDLTSQEEIKPEINNYHPLVSITLPSPNPSILLNHHLKENLNPGLVMTSMTLKTPRITSVTNSWTQNEVTYQELAGMSMGITPRSLTSRTTSQTTLPARHFKENLDPGLVPIPPTPPTPLIETQTQTDSPTSHLNHDVKKIPYQGLIETPPEIARIPLTAPTSHFFSSNKEIPHQGSATKPPVILIIPPRAPTTELKSRGTLKRIENESNTQSNPGVKHHTSVNKQTGSAHNLPQDTRPISRTGSVRCLYSRTTMGQGRPPETQEFSFPFVQKETGRGGSRSQG